MPKTGSSRAKKRGPTVPPEASAEQPTSPEPERLFPIVGIGASAGGYEAFTQLLHRLPAHSGMAFVFVQHLDARHESMLSRLLASATVMPIAQVEEGMRVEPDHVYVIPPDADISILGGVLHLAERKGAGGKHLPVDHFLRALAEDQGARAIGVILSGTASDGTLGLKAVKVEGGITFAQEPESAKYDGMPRSAIAAGCVDFVLTPEQIAAELVQITRHPYVLAPRPEAESDLPPGEWDWGRILRLLRTASGVDLTHYKQSTIRRRVARRMALQKIEGLSAYLSHLEANREELTALYQDILIHVTEFFREPAVFEALQSTILPQVLAGKTVRDSVRIWIPGCSSGEEVYSIAMCVVEALEGLVTVPPIQIFGTDISEQAIEKARAGVYPENALVHIPRKRVSRFFSRTNGNYQVTASLRDTCTFARHDLIKDPPFSRLDLISCCNVLIYLEPVLQKKVLASFHYALKDTGFLLLGKSETLSAFPSLFTIVDRKHKFFTKNPLPGAACVTPPETDEKVGRPERRTGEAAPFDPAREADRVIWERYSHAGLVVDDEFRILHFRGDTSPYLRPASGKATLYLFKMLRDELVYEMRAAMNKARRTGGVVNRQGIQLEDSGRSRDVGVEVRPLSALGRNEKYFLVLFDESGSAAGTRAEPVRTRKRRGTEAQEVLELRNEVTRTKEYLQAIIQEQELTNEELKSANEEALSSMEELQSTNEELETAKEELQSTNEELVTLNEQAQIRNAELAQLGDDLRNLINGVNIPILMLAGDRRIRWFTPAAEKLLHLLPGDIGRPITDVRLGLNPSDLDELIAATVGGGRDLQREVQAEDDHWYSVRTRPYRTADGKIDGGLLAFVDIQELKQIQGALNKEGQFVRAILDGARDLLVVVQDRAGRIVRFNRVCQELTGYSPDEVQGKAVWDFLLVPEEIARVKAAFEELVVSGKSSQWENQWLTKDGRRRSIAWSNSVATSDTGVVEYLIRTGVDVTERQHARAQARDSRATVEALLETASQAILAVDTAGRIVLANATAETMFGYDREEMLGQPIENLLPERYRQEHIGHRPSYALDPRNRPMGVGLDLAGLRKDGSEFPVEISLSHVQTEDATLSVAFVTDITERKRNEEALRESEARLRLAQQVALVGTFDWNIQTGVNQWTPELEAVYGLPPGGFARTQEAWEALVYPEDRPKVLQAVREAMETGRFECEWRITRPDGTARWIAGRASVFKDELGKPLRLIGMNIDITERKRAQDELRESNDRFRNMADNAPVMIWVSGEDKLCTFCNKRWLDFVGRTLEQELGTGWLDGVHPDDLDRCKATYSSAFDERHSFQMEYRMRRADGEYRWLLDSGVPRFTEGGGFAGYIGSCIDITDIKGTQEQIFHAQKLESLGVLAGGIAHDFNNLLGTILIDVESILLDLGAGSPGEAEATRIKRVAFRAAEIVRELMTYAGKEAAAVEPVEVGRLISEMLELLKVSITKNATLRPFLASNLPAIRGNASQLRQIVMNLLTNASEALEEREGVITITTSQAHIPGDRLPNGAADLPDGDYIRLEVSDTGSGMTKETQARIFEPFFTTKFAGRGLGLAAVQGIIRSHGGTISLVSAPGDGTCFTVLLPCIPEADPQSPNIGTITSKHADATVTGKVLVVDDEDSLRHSISKMLRRKGFSVLEAGEGSAAINLFEDQGHEIDAVLLDMTLPGMSGRDILLKLRQRRPDVKVILTTAYSQEIAMTAAGEQSASAFIRKPYKIDDLVKVLAKVLSE